MSKAKLNVAFLWHQHQPYYKNNRGYYHMPWVRFHGTKDYLDMLLILKEFPEIKQNINLVPSLLLQLEDYAHHDARDNIWILTEKSADQLTAEDKIAILENFFLANVPHMIKPYPRYYELYMKNKYDARYLFEAERADSFSARDYRDLQVWYNLTWIGQVSRQRPAIQALFKKGHDFSEEDKTVLLSETRNILKDIIPMHKTMWESGQIELSTTPFYHPILPLLIDSNIARESTPDITLPSQPFTHPEDAEEQIRRGLEYFETLFGRKPEGMWPSEGSVSEAAARMIANHHIRWIATDEAILARSMGKKIPTHRIYQPHCFSGTGRNIHIFFRDHYLSDTIGFVYSNWQEDRAVEDFLSRLHNLRKRIVDEVGEEKLHQYVASVILDGENCWEHYPDDGRPFLRKLYQGISEDPLLNSCTFGEFLDQSSQNPKLYHLFPGSWINANFNIWIGAEEDNRAWDLLKQTRDFLVAKEQEGVLPPDKLSQAWEHIYIAEGSDWCWWYGDEHSSKHDLEFDQLFREHLMSVYEIAGGEIPAELYQTIKKTHFDRFSSIRPLNFIHPVIDGKVSHYYEWVGAALYEGRKMEQAAMHQVSRIIDKFYVGFDLEHLYLRIDFAQPPELLYEYVISAKTPRQITVVFSPLQGIIEKYETHGESIEKTVLEPRFKIDSILEAALAFKDLDLEPGVLFGFQLHIKMNGQQVETFPHTKIIEVEVPDETYEYREWSV